MKDRAILPLRKSKMTALFAWCLIFVKDPQKYIDRETNWFKKKMLQASLKTSQTLFRISAVNLQITYEELLNLLVQNHSKYGG